MRVFATLARAVRALPATSHLTLAAPRAVNAAARAASTAVAASAPAPAAAPSPAADVPGATLSGGPKKLLIYTCRVCETRSARTISEAAYAEGVVLVRCPGCEKLHLIADRLGYFSEGGGASDIEALLAARGERVRTGALTPRLATSAAAAARVLVAAAEGAPGGAADPAGAAAASVVATGADGDPHVFEFSADDLRVLRSASKSVSMAARAASPAAASGVAAAETVAAAAAAAAATAAV